MSAPGDHRTGALTARYIAALATVAALSIVGQVLVQAMLDTHQTDSRVINVAGRQRMLSQRVVKTALTLERTHAPEHRAELGALAQEWAGVQRGLRFGDTDHGLPGHNSAEIDAAFQAIEPDFFAMYTAAAELLEPRPEAQAAHSIDELLAHETGFLDGMDRIVSLYEVASFHRVRNLRRVEFTLLLLVLLTLLLEGLFVFRPAVHRIRHSLDSARRSESEKADILRAMPDALLRVDRRGVIDGAFAHAPITGAVGTSLTGLIGARYGRTVEKSIARAVEHGQESRFEFQRGHGHEHVEARVVPCAGEEVLVILRDISDRRQLEKELLVVAEREQTRIGMDLHDGLCQHLAGLAIMARSLANQVEQGKLTAAAELKDDLASIAQLLHDGVAMARQMARGLFPEVLVDQGLAAALEQACTMAETLHKGVSCTCELGLEGVEVDQDTAFQIFRIAQEAVGNAIRHGKATHILSRVDVDGDELVLRVTDNGVGMAAPPRKSPGIGLRSMSTRARTIGATLTIEPAELTGTTVECRVPLDQAGDQP